LQDRSHPKDLLQGKRPPFRKDLLQDKGLLFQKDPLQGKGLRFLKDLQVSLVHGPDNSSKSGSSKRDSSRGNHRLVFRRAVLSSIPGSERGTM
jgi:hypothetical protein